MMNNRYIKAQAPATSVEWVRNPDWLPLPTFAPSDNRIAVLIAVVEGVLNYTTIAGGAGAAASTVYWGDGTSTLTNGTYQTKEYIYSAITGTVSVDEFGRNYKQVIMDIIIPASSTLVRLERTGTGIYRNKPSHYLDFKCQSNTLNTLDLFFDRNAPYLEKLDVSGCTVSGVYGLTNITKSRYIRSLAFNKNITSSLASFCAYQQMIEDFGDFTTSSSNISGFFNSSNIKTVGNITANSTLDLGSLFFSSDVRQVGNISAPSCTQAYRLFRDAVNLTKIGTLNLPLVTTLQEAFYNTNIEEIVFTSSCALITNVTSAFVTYNLKRLVTPNLTRGVSIPYANMTAAALNEFFTSLGTATGAQTITITGNPGSLTCNTSIATAKGFTVVT